MGAPLRTAAAGSLAGRVPALYRRGRGGAALAANYDYNEDAVHAVLDESFAAFGLEAVLRELILPILAQVGRDWEQGKLAISQEHFAGNLIRARLLSLARLRGRGGGPVALLACTPGEP